MFKQLDLFAAFGDEPPKKAPEYISGVKAEAEAVPDADEIQAELETEPIAIQEPELIEFDTVFTNSSAPATAEKVSKKTAAQSAPAKKRGRKSIKDMEAEAEHIEIPADEILFQKSYYSIGQVAAMFKLNNSLLRYWETEFDILKPRKNRKGDRHFRPEDIKNLALIHYLLRQRKYTIEGAKEYLKTSKSMAEENFKVVSRLKNIRSFLLELKAGL